METIEEETTLDFEEENPFCNDFDCFLQRQTMAKDEAVNLLPFEEENPFCSNWNCFFHRQKAMKRENKLRERRCKFTKRTNSGNVDQQYKIILLLIFFIFLCAFYLKMKL
jgi:hypothetical protein